MLQINNKQGIIEIEGNLVSTNSKSLKSHFESLFKTEKKIILSLEKLNNIDNSGVNCISSIYKMAANSNIIFYVIGKTNQNISKSIKNTKLNYIIKQDFL